MHIVLKRSVVTGAMDLCYEQYIFHISIMKIVAKLINSEQIQPSYKQIFETKF